MEANTKKYAAEFIGTFALVSSVCGAALFSAPSAGLMTVAFAIGAIVLAMAYAVGPISGGHFNPAVTCGLVAAGRCPAADAIPYIIAQLLGGVAAAAGFYVIPCYTNNFCTQRFRQAKVFGHSIPFGFISWQAAKVRLHMYS